MSELPLVSIIITSYNYARYLGQAIDSALSQTYSNTEVIVVDDGSTDNSREVIAQYGRLITPVLKVNKGQGSAFNAGFSKSRGNIVLFLDSDDLLLPSTGEAVVGCFRQPEVVKVHWPLWIIDKDGRRTGKVKEPQLPEGDFRDIVRTQGPMTEATLPSAPTSGNAYARTFLRQVLPLPEDAYRISPDAYLFGLAPAFGLIKTIHTPQGLWRFHGSNASKGTTFEERVALGVSDHEQQCSVLSRFFGSRSVRVDVASWRNNGWWPRIHLALQEIARVIPEGETFILADGDSWGTDEILMGYRRLPFLERQGQYWGAPSDDAEAISELERLQQSGAGYLVVGWPAFWWLDYCPGFHNYLRSRFPCIRENDRVVVFDLKRAQAEGSIQ